jgi:hypothetical protein
VHAFLLSVHHREWVQRHACAGGWRRARGPGRRRSPICAVAGGGSLLGEGRREEGGRSRARPWRWRECRSALEVEGAPDSGGGGSRVHRRCGAALPTTASLPSRRCKGAPSLPPLQPQLLWRCGATSPRAFATAMPTPSGAGLAKCREESRELPGSWFLQLPRPKCSKVGVPEEILHRSRFLGVFGRAPNGSRFKKIALLQFFFAKTPQLRKLQIHQKYGSSSQLHQIHGVPQRLL